MNHDVATLRSVTARVLDSLPSQAIGDIYCDEGGAEFFAAIAPRIVELGTEAAVALADRLGTLGGPPVSLYVGAGIAELPMMLAEALWLERTVFVCNLRGAECQLLERALLDADAISAGSVRFRAVDAASFVADPSNEIQGSGFSHLSMVSVITDPETYPTLSDLTYGRISPVQLDVDAFAAERQAVRDLLDAICDSLARPGLVTTTGEEGPWLFDWLARAAGSDGAFEIDDEVFEAPVVGDPIGFLRLLATPAGPECDS